MPVMCSPALRPSQKGQRRSLGAANAVTLARANLPALASGPWTGLAALAADLLDGQLARRADEVTVFGSYADTLADAAFWTWFAARHEPSRVLRTAAFAAWTAPVAAATALSVTRGRMTGILRHELLRPAAPLEVLLLARACARHATHKKLAFCTPPDTSPRRLGRRRLLRH